MVTSPSGAHPSRSPEASRAQSGQCVHRARPPRGVSRSPGNEPDAVADQHGIKKSRLRADGQACPAPGSRSRSGALSCSCSSGSGCRSPAAWCGRLGAIRRPRAMAAFARANGWSYESRGWRPLRPGPPYWPATSTACSDVVTGLSRGVPFVAYEYAHQAQVVRLELPLALPLLEVRPHGIDGGTTLTLPNLTLESEAFNRQFWVHADDPRFASSVLHPRLMQALLAALPPVLGGSGATTSTAGGRESRLPHGSCSTLRCCTGSGTTCRSSSGTTTGSPRRRAASRHQRSPATRHS